MNSHNREFSQPADTIAILGAGLIGCSWAALFAASGRRIHLYDRHADAGANFIGFWAKVSGILQEIGLCQAASRPDFEVFATPAEAVAAAGFVQESIPERLELKHALYRQIEPALGASAVVATSSSGLKLSDLQRGWRDPGKLIIAHPFNPPHLVPLVELYGNEATAPQALALARELYESCGKRTITLRREVMGHVANRLQAALWREAIHLVTEDVVSVRDVDLAISAGPGMRWAVMGPHMLLNLGGGSAGIRGYCEQFRDSYARWWEDLGQPQLDDATVARLIDGLEEEIAGRGYEALVSERDAKLVALQNALAEVDRKSRPEARNTVTAGRMEEA